VDVHRDVHAGNQIEVIDVVEPDLHRDDLGDLLEVSAAVALREQRENRGSSSLDFPDAAGERGIRVGINQIEMKQRYINKLIVFKNTKFN